MWDERKKSSSFTTNPDLQHKEVYKVSLLIPEYIWGHSDRKESVRDCVEKRRGIQALQEWEPSFSSVQFSCSVMSDSLWPHGLQHIRLPCPSPTPRAYSNSCPLSRWCHPTNSTSVTPFSSCLQSFQHQVAKVLEFQLQHQSVQWIFRTDFL